MTTFNKYLEDFALGVRTSNKEAVEILHDTAKNALELNSRQRDAIMSRCTNYLSGTSFANLL